jgi:hypothetical protein
MNGRRVFRESAMDRQQTLNYVLSTFNNVTLAQEGVHTHHGAWHPLCKPPSSCWPISAVAGGRSRSSNRHLAMRPMKFELLNRILTKPLLMAVGSNEGASRKTRT